MAHRCRFVVPQASRTAFRCSSSRICIFLSLRHANALAPEGVSATLCPKKIPYRPSSESREGGGRSTGVATDCAILSTPNLPKAHPLRLALGSASLAFLARVCVLKRTVSSLVLLFGAAACVGACSSDNDRDKSAGGSSPVGGSPSTSASATGGKADVGASATGGIQAATGGDPSTGGWAATGGVTPTGGSSGTGAPTLAQSCSTICELASGLASCSTTLDACNQECVGYEPPNPHASVRLLSEYTDLMTCTAQNLRALADYVCASDGALNEWSYAASATSCNPQLCTWTCDDLTYVDANMCQSFGGTCTCC